MVTGSRPSLRRPSPTANPLPRPGRFLEQLQLKTEPNPLVYCTGESVKTYGARISVLWDVSDFMLYFRRLFCLERFQPRGARFESIVASEG